MKELDNLVHISDEDWEEIKNGIELKRSIRKSKELLGKLYYLSCKFYARRNAFSR